MIYTLPPFRLVKQDSKYITSVLNRDVDRLNCFPKNYFGNFEITNKYSITSPTTNYTYEECMFKKAQELLDEYGEKLLIMYSGGVDSCAMLVALAQLSKNTLNILMDNDCIIENKSLFTYFKQN